MGVRGHAQNEDDALRYSETFLGGTARNMGYAGALSAMGGDFANAAQNPAGLGRLTKSNFSFTQNIEVNAGSAQFGNNVTRDAQAKYNWSNFSYVKAYELNPNQFKNWYAVQIGIGFNRIKSFNQNYNYEGVADSSILHSFIREAEGTDPNDIYAYHPFTAGLAYDTYAIDPAANNTYTTQAQAGGINHKRTMERTGGMNEFNLLTVSGNYGNKLLLGASFNYLRIQFNETFKHTEDFAATSWVESIDYTGRLNIKGNGVNARFGAIYMPIPQFRLGAAIETPSFFWMNDYWTNDMESETEDGPKFVDPQFVPSGSFDYRIRTPFKANLSFATVIKEIGSIGAEVEFVDYGNAKLSSRNFSNAFYSFDAENVQIENIYRSVVNFKVGFEARVTNQIYARGGLAHYASPFKSSSGNLTSSRNFITAGAGYNFGVWYLDMAYALRMSKEDYFAYDPTIEGSQSTFDFNNSRILFSVGARF